MIDIQINALRIEIYEELVKLNNALIKDMEIMKERILKLEKERNNT